MPYANNQGIRIHYEVEGAGPPLVLQHGSTAWLESFYDTGYVDGLKEDYQLILMDARGHGASDKPHEPEAYGRALMASDVVAVLDDLGISKAHFLGLSMGGQVGWAIAKFFPERFHSLIIVSAVPVERDPSEPSPWAEQQIALMRQDRETIVTAMEKAFGQWWRSGYRERYLAADLEAHIARFSLREWVGLEDALPTMETPCLVTRGELEPNYSRIEELVRGMPNAVFVGLPGLAHFDACCRTDLLLPHIRQFLASVPDD